MATVLLVDDDRMVLALCGYILTDIGGLDVLQAGNSDQAIDVADHHCGKIDLLLSDIAMPGGLSGIQLAETLTNSRPDMKVLLMSAFNCEESIFNSGWLFISKPFRPAALVSKIEEALGQQLHPNSGNSGAAGQTAA